MLKRHKVREFTSPLGLTVRHYQRTLWGWWKKGEPSYWTVTVVQNEHGPFTWVNARESLIMEVGKEYRIPVWGTTVFSHAQRQAGSHYSVSFQFVGKNLKRTLFLSGDNEITTQILYPNGTLVKAKPAGDDVIR